MNLRRGPVLAAIVAAFMGAGNCGPLASRPSLRSPYLHFVADLGGPYREVGYDADRDVAVVATRNALHLVAADPTVPQDSAVTSVELEGFRGPGRIVPAREGGVVLTFHPREAGFDRASVHNLDGNVLGTITAVDGLPFRTLLIGGPGRTIATISERRGSDPSEGPEWRWDTWRPDGSAIAHWTTPPGVKAAFDRTGQRILLLFADRAELRDVSGRVVDAPVAGRFHKGALSDLGRVIVLADDRDRRSVVVVTRGAVRRGRANAPLHGLRVAPDGRSAWAWFRDAEIRSLSVADAAFGDPVSLPAAWGARSVTSFVARNARTAWVALATTSATSGARGGRIVRISGKEVLWETELPTVRPTAFLPAVLPAEGSVLAWNREILATFPAPEGDR